MPPEAMHFADYQAAFAARIRDPKVAPRPGCAPARRMRVYEMLLFNNLEGFLLACYPITRKLLGARAWRATVKRFFAESRGHSPLFRDIPQTFLDWMATVAPERFPDWPFLHEFMHYEWLEMAVSIAPELIDPVCIDPEGDLLDGCPVVEPSARLACYRYPVHRVGPRFKPDASLAGEYCYLVFRDPGDIVRFIQINPLSARLLERLRERPCTGREALLELASRYAPDQQELYLSAGAQLLHKLLAQDALIGTWRTAS